MNESDLLTLLRAATSIDQGCLLMRCPAHRGGLSSSLEVVWDAGRLRLRCMAGCSPEAIMRAAQHHTSCVITHDV